MQLHEEDKSWGIVLNFAKKIGNGKSAFLREISHNPSLIVSFMQLHMIVLGAYYIPIIRK